MELPLLQLPQSHRVASSLHQTNIDKLKPNRPTVTQHELWMIKES